MDCQVGLTSKAIQIIINYMISYLLPIENYFEEEQRKKQETIECFEAYRSINNDHYFLTCILSNRPGRLYIDDDYFYDLNLKQCAELKEKFPHKWDLQLDSFIKYRVKLIEHLKIILMLKKQKYLVAEVKRNILTLRGAQFGCIYSQPKYNEDEIPALTNFNQLPQHLKNEESHKLSNSDLQSLIYNTEDRLYIAKREYDFSEWEYKNSKLEFEKSLTYYENICYNE
jgi:hypothetical protein